MGVYKPKIAIANKILHYLITVHFDNLGYSSVRIVTRLLAEWLGFISQQGQGSSPLN
jgi:hypothetical protein